MHVPWMISQAAAGVAALWNGAARLRVGLYRNGMLARKRLQGKVISVGNIAWGGSGKTPFTIWLASRLQERSLRVSILSRGYRRASRERVQVIPPGTTSEDAADAGEEVRLYLRNLPDSVEIPIGVSASRYDAGRLLEARFPVEIHLLDDGFQHLALHRDLDLVLVDAQNPWGRRGLFRSLLRESPSSLARADAILLTRCELAPPAPHPNSVEALQTRLLSRNPGARFFTARTQLTGFRAKDGSLIAVKEFRSFRPLAFCGLGNPGGFLGTLKHWDIPVLGHRIFPDHHRYSRADLQLVQRLAEGARADCLVTTEKDWVNLPPDVNSGQPIYWAETDLEVADESRLLLWISERLGLRLAGSTSPSERFAGGPPDQPAQNGENQRERFVSGSGIGRL